MQARRVIESSVFRRRGDGISSQLRHLFCLSLSQLYCEESPVEDLKPLISKSNKCHRSRSLSPDELQNVHLICIVLL